MVSSAVYLILAFAASLPLGEGWIITIKRDNEVVCSGALINNKFFLTLGDCINEKKLEDYTVLVGENEVRHISYILKSPEGDDIITGRLSTKVMFSQPDINKVSMIATEAQIIKARRNSKENYAIGTGSKGNAQFIQIDVLPDKKCEDDFERNVHFCVSKLKDWPSWSICSFIPGSSVVTRIGKSMILLGLTSFTKSCKDEQTYAFNIAKHRRWINNIISLKAGSICTSNDECGENMKCEKNKCACTYCYTSVDGNCEASDKKVLVLGAGMAGISAAKTLGESGCSNVLVLEGSDRVGGRVKSVNMSGYTMELGAQWIYGLGTNPMATLADKYGFAMAEDDDTWVFRDNFGNNFTEKADNYWYDLQKVLKKSTKFAREMHENGEPDITAEALLRKFGWNPEDNFAEAVEHYEVDLETTREMPSVSGKYLNHLRVFEEHESDDWLIASDPRGYSYIIEEMSKEFQDGQRILFNKKVTSIENWHDEQTRVKVQTEDGSVYRADDVILTFSLGVLQSRQVEFIPPLSEKKMMAIDKFGFGPYTLMYFKFSTAFWDDTTTIVYASERHGDHSIWFNMNKIYPGCNILQLSLTSFEAEAAERREDAENIERAMVVLRSMYPAANISEPESFVKSNWLSDPLTKGSFCYWTPAFRSEDMDTLGMSEGNLHFAGEYISQTNYAFVHSAYNSGKNTAMDLAEIVSLEELADFTDY